MMNRILRFLIETNLFIAFAAVAFLWANIYWLNIQISTSTILSVQVFFSTWFVYQISRWVYYIKGEYGNKEELIVKWFEKYPKIVPISIVLSLIISVDCVFYFKIKTIIVLCIIGLVSVLYPIPVLKPFGINTRLRDFPFIKIFLIAFVWSTTSVVLPFTESGLLFSDRKDIIMIWLMQFIYILFITLPFDINDAETDKNTGTKTIATVFGIKTSKYIGLVLGILHTFLLIYAYMLENWRSIQHIYLNEWAVLSILILTILLQWFTFKHSDKVEKRTIKIVYDGSMIIYFLIMYLNHFL
jgi:4-hydroxybenzoate polyprenyltransferase